MFMWRFCAVFCPSANPPVRWEEGEAAIPHWSCLEAFTLLRSLLCLIHTLTGSLQAGWNGNTLANTAASRTDSHTYSYKHTHRQREVQSYHICVSRCSCQSSPRISHLSLIQNQSDWRQKPTSQSEKQQHLLWFLWHRAKTCSDSRPPPSVPFSLIANRPIHTHQPFSSCCSIISPWHPPPPHPYSSLSQSSSIFAPVFFPFFKETDVALGIIYVTQTK